MSAGLLVLDDPYAATGDNQGIHQGTDEVACQRLATVNVVYVGSKGAGDREWVSIDVGNPGSAPQIRRTVAGRYGEDSRPAAILLTHAHFDRAGDAGTRFRPDRFARAEALCRSRRSRRSGMAVVRTIPKPNT